MKNSVPRLTRGRARTLPPMRRGLLALALAPIAEGGCWQWRNTPGQNCGWTDDDSCAATNAAEPTIGVAPSNIATCRETCAATAGCVAVNYAHPGEGGSGGPGRTVSGSGACYYRSATDCGLKCQSGRDCWRLSGDGCTTLDEKANARVVGEATCLAAEDEEGGGAMLWIAIIVGVILAIALVALCTRRRSKENYSREGSGSIPAAAAVVVAEPMPIMTAVAVPVGGPPVAEVTPVYGK